MLYDSATLIGAIERMASEGPGSYFRDRYFGSNPLFSTDENIYFDIVDSAKRLAPYVSPLVQGVVMEHRGFATRQFTPPYLKPKGVIDPNQHMFTRLPGEAITGDLSPDQRRQRHIASRLEEHELAITHREEFQVMEAIRLGQVTVQGEGYGTRVLAFGRNAAHTIALAGANLWTDPAATPLNDIQNWVDLVFTNSGAAPSDVYFGATAWTNFLARLTAAQQTLLFDSLRGSTSRAEFGPQRPDYVKFRGSYGDLNFYTVSNAYQTAAGAPVQLLPINEVAMAAPAIEGRMAYAAIRDAKAGMASVRAFPKLWYEEDPPVEYVMTQSAPLAIPLRPDASLGATVV